MDRKYYICSCKDVKQKDEIQKLVNIASANESSNHAAALLNALRKYVKDNNY